MHCILVCFRTRLCRSVLRAERAETSRHLAAQVFFGVRIFDDVRKQLAGIDKVSFGFDETTFGFGFC
jgi:hypothetical protein